MNTQNTPTRRARSRTPMCRRVRGTRFGSSAAATNVFVCGKLKPCGSFHGPNTS